MDRGLGLTYELRHDSERAIEYYERALAITEEHGELLYRSYVLCWLATALWRHRDPARANRLLAQALRVSRTAKRPHEHEYVPTNTGVDCRGSRKCRACGRVYSRW
ncbi:tetratricopeptide repeat protein [Nocardia pseudovaccinii]|uniref:tetratricopeptide repeat protein n=1 Tax=Nocardia pseudovaccinii TaxID=189540 RepID=UPI003D9369AF